MMPSLINQTILLASRVTHPVSDRVENRAFIN